MKISTRGRYGIKAMVDLAQNSYNTDNKCVSLKSIAERQGIPENYLEQLMASLKKAGIVNSVRGAQGGYVLNKQPEDISVGDLLKVLEGNIAIVDCLENQPPKKKCGTANCSKCNMIDAWKIISNKFEDAVNSISLKDLIQEFE